MKIIFYLGIYVASNSNPLKQIYYSNTGYSAVSKTSLIPGEQDNIKFTTIPLRDSVYNPTTEEIDKSDKKRVSWFKRCFYCVRR
jgi:hypothetical protein